MELKRPKSERGNNKKRLQTNPDSDKVIRRPGMMDFIPWAEYTGCCKPGEYDAELKAMVKIHYADPPELPKKRAKTVYTVTLPSTKFIKGKRVHPKRN